MSKGWKNQLYFGDNLDILKQLHAQHPEGFIDLIYIDPPFNSKRNYNVLFESVDLNDATAQKEAFADTWSNVSYMDTLNQLSELDISLYIFLKNLDNTNISRGATSYLTIMAIRIWYMRALMKPTGSFYLHCDTTMSHYLKIVCDLIFGEKNFRNEISWKRSQPKSHAYSNFANCRDVILRYTRTERFTFNRVYGEYDQEYLDKFYRFKDAQGRRYRLGDLTNPNKDRPNLTYEFLGVTRVWRWTKERMEKAYEDGRIYQTKPGQVPQYIRYFDEMPGQPLTDDWDDIEHLHGSNSETLGYPTQKPVKLLDRIISASTNEGDVVADFFCGCGTTIAAAEAADRKWIGVDISHLAVQLISKRLADTYGETIIKTFEIHGFPKDIASARELASGVKGGRLEFEDWIIEILLHGVTNERRNEMGYDGYRTFEINGQKYVVMIEVKSGHASPTQLNHFIMTVKDKGGAIGVFVCFKDQVTRNMEIIAKNEGLFSDQFGLTYGDKIQILTVEDLLSDRRPAIPASRFETFKQAEKKTTDKDTQGKLNI